MTLSEIVPKNHFLKKVAEAIDFKFIYDLTEKYFSIFKRFLRNKIYERNNKKNRNRCSI